MSEVERLFFSAWVHEEFAGMFDQEWSRAVDEALGISPGWVGFPGVLHTLDEVSVGNPSWTPAEFTEFWDWLTHDQKIEYIKSLIT